MIFGSAITAWFSLSIIFMWKPVVTYSGQSLSACLNELRGLEGLQQMWAIETNQEMGAEITLSELQQYYDTHETYKMDPEDTPFHCPGHGVYTLNPLGQSPSCSLAGQEGAKPRKVRDGLFHWRWDPPPSAPHGSSEQLEQLLKE